jgi:hypothetical protein
MGSGAVVRFGVHFETIDVQIVDPGYFFAGLIAHIGELNGGTAGMDCNGGSPECSVYKALPVWRSRCYGAQTS